MEIEETLFKILERATQNAQKDHTKCFWDKKKEGSK